MPDHTPDADPAEARLALLRLVACGGPAAPRRRLLEHIPDPRAAIADAAACRDCGLSSAQLGALRGPAPDTLRHARDWLQAPRHHLIGWHDPDYPPLLRRSPAPPLALFVAGDPALLWHPAVAVVGSRAPTPGGRDNAAAFARALVGSGLAVASGLAAGIDTAAHAATLAAGGHTVAVLGTGPDIAYPRGNRELHARIATAGALVSEHLPGTGPRKEHFPSRNRILAGIALGTLVIEAAERSGALITARLAAESGREVFALPGSIHNPLARGCHRLIRDGAALVENAQQVTEALAPVAEALAGALRRRLAAPIAGDGEHGAPARVAPERAAQAQRLGATRDDADYQRLWNALGFDPTGMDELVQRSRLTTAQVSSMLLLMELEGRVAAHHGRYTRSR
ncbi:DNA-processing protein DprA [Lysobacter sp. D1-1-M9]|uniref:DNA-processing protein DprA n=3 Tax=Novilysobacter longmucuonensis TaxID=3098603 RepID=UPI0039836E82